MWSKVSSIEHMFLKSMNGSEAFRAVPDGRPFLAMTSRLNVVVFFGKRSETNSTLILQKVRSAFQEKLTSFFAPGLSRMLFNAKKPPGGIYRLRTILSDFPATFSVASADAANPLKVVDGPF